MGCFMSSKQGSSLVIPSVSSLLLIGVLCFLVPLLSLNNILEIVHPRGIEMLKKKHKFQLNYESFVILRGKENYFVRIYGDL